ncbi:MAG: hypothetical protein AB9M53_09940 [Leptothrix sp. (in: b-proteobacteria)]
MNGVIGMRLPPVEVPTLTEVVGFDGPMTTAEVAQTELVSDGAMFASEPVLTLRDPGISEEQIAQRVLTDLQRHVDLMFEYRLRETLSPLLTRLADNMVREVREELSSTLRDVVRRAVTQELARQKAR